MISLNRVMARFHEKLMTLGHMTGCHQLPERSLFVHGYQFPLCARCTGALIGQTVGLITFWLFIPHISVLFLFCCCMGIDWLIQYLSIRDSTNCRRVVTGALCGYALITIHLAVICIAAGYLFGLSDNAFIQYVRQSIW